jgi:hypothetical protein
MTPSGQKQPERPNNWPRTKDWRLRLSHEAWSAFLDSHWVINYDSGQRAGRFNNHPFRFDASTFHRWRRGDGTTGFYLADEFLIRFGLDVQDFFDFCRERDLEPWLYPTDELRLLSE